MKISTIARLAILCLVLPSVKLFAQTTVAFQGGEGTLADNWSFSAIANVGGPLPPGIVTTHAASGTAAIRAGGGDVAGCSGGSNCIAGMGGSTGCPMHGNTIEFAPVNVACLSGVQLSVAHRSHTFCSGGGFDLDDSLSFEVRLNGGSWTTVQTLKGNNDYAWTYATNPAGNPAIVPNPWVYSVPPGTQTFEFRARAGVNRSDEVFYLDDVRLTTTTPGYSFPGTAGLWNGLQNDNWFNACNWDSRTVPNSATDVTFPVGAANDIVVQAGQNCQCHNLTLTGSSGRAIKAEAGATKVITCFGDLNINTTTAAPALDFDDGTAAVDGRLNLYGNWNNNSDEASFAQGGSAIHLLGSTTQTISLATGQPYEVFSSLVVNKPAGETILGKSLQIQNQLTLTLGDVRTNANHLYVSNSATNAIVTWNINSYVNGRLRREILTGPGTRTYVFPLGTFQYYEWSSLSLTNPAGMTYIEGSFDSTITGVVTPFTQAGYLYNTLLNGGFWTFAATPAFGGTAHVSINQMGYTNGGALRYTGVWRPNAGTNWTDAALHQVFSTGASIGTQRAPYTVLGDFAISLTNTPLPAPDVALAATPVPDGTIRVDWTWSVEQPGTFDLTRQSETGLEALGEWPSEGRLAASTLDAAPPAGWVRYELHHTDADGFRSLVATDEAWIAGDGSVTPRLWPNPSNGKVHLQIPDGRWSLQVLRADGAEVLGIVGDASDLKQTFENVAPTLASGIYLLQIGGSEGRHTLKWLRN